MNVDLMPEYRAWVLSLIADVPAYKWPLLVPPAVFEDAKAQPEFMALIERGVICEGVPWEA